jgi:hypothetical protein
VLLVETISTNSKMIYSFPRKFSFGSHLEFSGHLEFYLWIEKNISFLEFVLQEYAKISAF